MRKRKDFFHPSIEQIENEKKRLEYKEQFKKALRTTVYALVVVAAVAVLVASILLPVLQISGSSMEPILSNDDIILLVKTKSFGKGDLCSFTWNNKTLVKRVIAGPGDWVDISDDGDVYVNGALLDEPYIVTKSIGECDIDLPYQVPEHSWFVMGDKRDISIDSRSTLVGAVDEEQIIGKVWIKIYPFDGFGRVK